MRSDPREPGGADRAARAVATGLGIGFAPIVPGTFGSLPGVALAWGLTLAGGAWVAAAGMVVVVAVGLWAADRTSRILGDDDPRCVVIDEVAGQMTTLLFLPPTIGTMVAGFLLFRILDILKPFPARRFEDLPGGSGIMADDLVAGLYANLILQGIAGLWPDAAAWMGLA